MTYEATFTKYRKGQTSFKRSVDWAMISMLLLLSDDLKIQYKQRKRVGHVTFIFNGEVNRFVMVKNLPHHLLSKLLPPEEWTEATV